MNDPRTKQNKKITKMMNQIKIMKKKKKITVNLG